jgi:hypothetical protein
MNNTLQIKGLFLEILKVIYKKFAPIFESGAKVKASDEKRHSKISHATVPLRRRGMQTVHTNMYKIRGEECRLLEQTLSYILYHYQFFWEIFLTIYEIRFLHRKDAILAYHMKSKQI